MLPTLTEESRGAFRTGSFSFFTQNKKKKKKKKKKTEKGARWRRWVPLSEHGRDFDASSRHCGTSVGDWLGCTNER